MSDQVAVATGALRIGSAINRYIVEFPSVTGGKTVEFWVDAYTAADAIVQASLAAHYPRLEGSPAINVRPEGGSQPIYLGPASRPPDQGTKP